MKFAICKANHFKDVGLPDTEYSCFCICRRKRGQPVLQIHSLTFRSLGSSFYLFKTDTSINCELEGEGWKMIIFLDDGFDTSDALSLAKDLSQHVMSDWLDSGFFPTVKLCLWIPVQELEWFGAVLNSIDFIFCISQRKVVNTASFVGQVISMGNGIWLVSQITVLVATAFFLPVFHFLCVSVTFTSHSFRIR